MNHDVLVLGGGLAGLASCAALAPRLPLTLLEARARLGGRASSFFDPHSNALIDNCQHVSMGCCTNLAYFFQSLGVAHLLQRQSALFFQTPDGIVSRFAADPLPAPLHLFRAFSRLHTLTRREKLHLAWTLAQLRFVPPQYDPLFLDWLRDHGQSARVIERFWSLVLVSALNDLPENVGLRYARKVFLDGFLRHRRGWEVLIPSVPLAELYGEPLQRWSAQQKVHLRFESAARHLHVANQRVTQVELRSGELLTPSWIVAAVPFARLIELLPPDVMQQPYFAGLRQLQTAPITSLHLWFDRPVLTLPHVVLVDSLGQWVFNRGQSPAGDYYLQIVVSASRMFRGLTHTEVQSRLVTELQQRFPTVAQAQLLRARVITERDATFCPVPGVDQWRPTQRSPLDNLFLAGDWTATGWPATMEGAVRSGYLAAEALLARLGTPVRFLQPDL